MKVLIFGGTGFIGKKLVETLKTRGHEVVISDVRSDSGYISKVQQADAVINLGGFPLFKKRWSTDVMAEIRDSRVDSTRQIVDAMATAQKTEQAPKVFINGSAIGFYGPGSFRSEFLEDSPAGGDFLAKVCVDWEEEALRAQRMLNIRTVLLRTGIVIGANGGVLQQLLPVFKFMQGSLIGTGEQPFSWIHIDDEVGIIIHALENEKVVGPLNAVSPKVVTNGHFSKALADAVSRPQVGLLGPELVQKTFGVFVKAMLYILVGGAAEVITTGQFVSPKKALETDYKFKYENIEAALKESVS